MYKRYIIGDSKAQSVGSIVSFFVFCTLLVWFIPFGVEIISGQPVELYMMPPTWRASILCGSVGDTTNYRYDNGICYTQCDTPVNCTEGISPVNSETEWKANLAAARQGINLYDVFEAILLALKYGTLLAALASIIIMRMYRSMILCIPCCILGFVVIIYPVFIAAAIPVWCVAYCIDMYTTIRFGQRRISCCEANPILRYLMKYGLRRAFILHSIIYAGLLASISYGTSIIGPLGIYQAAGMLLFGLAAAHLYAAESNTHEYDRMVV